MLSTPLMILIALHLLMGGFDTLYHHELREKLAWKKSQVHELKLHGIRNFFYALIYLCLGVVTPTGLWAYVLIAVLTIEMIITLIDFVEEDNSRKLPASERVLHTVLSLNFGAILALLIPRLWMLGSTDTALLTSWNSWWSGICLSASLLAVIAACRDLHAAARLKRLLLRPELKLINSGGIKRVLITGATGFIGSALVNSLQKAGHQVTALSRSMDNTTHFNAPITLLTNLNQINADTKIDVIINLAGATTAARWTPKHKDKMLDSRLDTTKSIIALIKRLEMKPELLISGSAIGFYGVNPSDTNEEDTPTTLDASFSQTLCQLWESEAAAATEFGVRVVLLRMGMVIDPDGGALAEMLVPTELGGGAVFGSGEQLMSWITREDLIRFIDHIIHDTNIEGPVNAVSPEPVANREFVTTLAKTLYRPTLIRIPTWFFTQVLGEFGQEILLADQDVVPIKATMNGFEFNHPRLGPALKDLLTGTDSMVSDDRVKLPKAVSSK